MQWEEKDGDLRPSSFLEVMGHDLPQGGEEVQTYRVLKGGDQSTGKQP